MRLSRIAIYAWIVLVFNIGVVLWGAYVRATGSGAGCGSHWPLCNGEILPRTQQLETAIEFTHRVTSGFAFLMVVVLFILSFRQYPKGHPVRMGAGLSMIFIISEALVGAGLVLFEWVADDVSFGRVVSMSVHLINTFLLLASLSLTAWWASGGEPVNLCGYGFVFWLFVIGFIGLLILGVSGAITALGDTIFPSETLAQGIKEDFSTSAHFLLRLRVWHPIIAILVGTYLMLLSGLVALFRITSRIRRLAGMLALLFVVQLIAGLINLILLAPIWLQLVHLLLADLVWITLALLAASNFAESELRHGITQSIKQAPQPS
jgi:heme A synthase